MLGSQLDTLSPKWLTDSSHSSLTTHVIQEHASAKLHVIDFWGCSHIIETRVIKFWMAKEFCIPLCYSSAALLWCSWMCRAIDPTSYGTNCYIFPILVSAFSVYTLARQLFLFALHTLSSSCFHSDFITCNLLWVWRSDHKEHYSYICMRSC